MDNEKNGADLSGAAVAEVTTKDMGERASVSEYAAFLSRAKQAKPEPETENKAADDAATETHGETATAETTAETAAEAEGDKPEGQEQPEEQPDANDEEVLSKSDSNKPDKLAKWQEKTQKRINELTAKAKAAEEALQVREQELQALKTAPKPEEKAAEPMMVPLVDPSDKTGAVFEEAEIVKLEREATETLDFIENNRPAIMRALAKDEPTVKIGGQEFAVEDIAKFERDAKRHIERYIPQRKQFLAVRSQSVNAAKQIMPSLFDKSSKDYQEMQALRRALPAVNAIPVFEQWYALGKLGQQYLAEQGKAKAEVKTAAATPPKAAADISTAEAPAKKTATGDKARLKTQLDQAENEYKSTRSKDSYARVLELQSKLKRIS